MPLALYIVALLAICAVVCSAALVYVRVRRQIKKPVESMTEVLMRSQIDAALRDEPSRSDIGR
jgi:hypothetical protein